MTANSAPPDPEPGGDLEELLVFIRDSRGFDFTGYKRSTLARRIRKRMADARIGDYADYRTAWKPTPKSSGPCSTPF